MSVVHCTQSNLFGLNHQITGSHADQLHAHSFLLLVQQLINIYPFLILRLGKEVLFYFGFFFSMELHSSLHIQQGPDVVQ